MGKLFSKEDKRVYYTMEEIIKHNHSDSLWVVSKNKVYDMTFFYKNGKHTGGQEPLLMRSGGVIDAVDDYNFHSKESKKQWNSYLIGYVKKM